MRITINLLPWRDARRDKQTRGFYALLILALGLGAALGGTIAVYYSAQLEGQLQRNTLIRQQLVKLDADISRVSDFKADASALGERLASYQALQLGRGDLVAVFNGISERMVEGVVFQRLSRTGSLFSVVANAETEGQVSEQLRQMSTMQSMEAPRLSEVGRDRESTHRHFRFEMRQLDAKDMNMEVDHEGKPIP